MRWTVPLLLALLLLPGADARAQAQGRITGSITSQEGQPLSGASVSVVGTALGALSGPDGRYAIEAVAPGTRTVRATLIGYAEQSREVSVTAGQAVTADFQLAPSALELEGIVAVGYGTQRREEVTGAVASVTAEDFVQTPARDAASLIVGKIAGLAVTTPSGDPRAGTEISLRGATTLNGPRSPLVLVDGVPGNLQTVAPQDVESISVLKDGSAAAVYGSRASNGVILITTKRHQGGAPTIHYDTYASYSTLSRSPDFLDADDYRRLIGEGYAFEDLGFETDWQDEMLRNPISHTHNVTMSGGAANTNYTAAFNYEDSEGLFRRSDNEEMTGRINIGHSMWDGRLTADLNLLGRTRSYFDGPSFNYAWRQTLIRNPTDRIQDEEGNWQERGTYFYTNPLGLIEEENGGREFRDLRLHGTLTYRPVQPLRLSLLVGTERGSDLFGTATTFRHVNTTQSGLNGTAARNTNANRDRILEFTGTLDQVFGNHDVTLLGGYSYQDFLSEGFNVSTYGFPTDQFGYDQIQAGDALNAGDADIGSYKAGNKIIGFFGRLNYDWDNRFLLMASLRHEGNSRFGADHKWGLFPGVSAGWRLSEESFLSGASFVDDLKLRAGFGVTGIAPNGNYLSLTSYDYGGRFLYNGEWVQGLSPARNPNPDLRWERKEELNVGLDFSLLNFRLSGSLDAYRRDTKGMLYNYSVPVPPNLFGNILANVGHMRNEGMEAQLSYDFLRTDNVSWTTTANWSTNSNELVSLSNDVYQPDSDYFYAGHTGEPIQLPTHRVDIGGPIGNFYGYESVDIDENGEWIVLNADGEPIPIRDVTEGDRRIIGNGVPKQYLSLNNAARFGNFDLNVNMRGAFGFQILNFQEMYYANPTILQYNMLESAFDPVYGKRTVDYDLAYVSYYIEDGDYWKVDNVTVGYTLGEGLLGSVTNVVNNARIYLSGSNLLTLTGYKGLDPEVSTNNLDPGIDHRDKYPTTRMFTAGMSLTF
jgi:TonB-linked SusC/RagA family outer membrane protein